MIAAVDVETTGLDWFRDQILCIGLVAEDGSKAVLRGADLAKSFEQVCIDLGITSIVGHNFSFDFKFLVQAGVSKDRLFQLWKQDTMLLAHTMGALVPAWYMESYEKRRIDANSFLPKGVSHRKAGPLSLKTLAPYHLMVKPFWETPEDHDNDAYVLKDCELTLRLYQHLKGEASSSALKFYAERMIPWAQLLTKTEMVGITLDMAAVEEVGLECRLEADRAKAAVLAAWRDAVDAYGDAARSNITAKYAQMCDKALAKIKPGLSPDKLGEKREKINKRYAQLEQAAKDRLPDFNIDSAAQVKWVLSDYYNLDVRDDQGTETTGKAVLKKMRDNGVAGAEELLRYKESNKVLTMYLPAYVEAANKSILHTNFKLAGTRTGRLSSSNINCQQIPSKLYKLFKPRPGYKFIKYDLSSIEAALIALYSQDPNLWDIVQSGGSLHNYNARVFFDLDCEPDEVPDKFPDERRAAKTVGFSLFYGAGPNRIKLAMATAGYIIDDRRAKELHRNFKRYFEVATEFHKEITRAFEAKQPINNILGRPLIVDPEDAYMTGFNTLIQSSGSDLNLMAYYKADKQWEELGLDAKGIFLIHDCVLAESKAEQSEEAARILREAMTGFNLECPLGKLRLGVDGGVSDVWEK